MIGVMSMPRSMKLITSRNYRQQHLLRKNEVDVNLETHMMGPNVSTKTGVSTSRSMKHITLHRISLVNVQSFYLIHPGINAGHPSGLNSAKWNDV